MRQRRAFGKAGGARGELDVDRLVELQLRGKLGEPLCFLRGAARKDFGEAKRAGMPAVAKQHDRPQRRQPCRFNFSGRRVAELGREFPQHADIVRSLESFGENERLTADFVERIFQLGDAIGGIDIDQDEPGLGGGELGEHPFRVVGRPDADAVAGMKPERQQTRGEPVDLLPQFAIAEPHLLMADHQCRPRRPFVADRVEKPANRLANERLFAYAIDVTERQPWHSGFLPPRSAALPEGYTAC